MVNNYKRKFYRNSWVESSMKNAIVNVFVGKIGLNKASHQFLLPKATLRRKPEEYSLLLLNRVNSL